MSRARTTHRPCPICGIALIAAEPQRDDDSNNLFQCPRCGLVIDVSVPARKSAGTEAQSD